MLVLDSLDVEVAGEKSLKLNEQNGISGVETRERLSYEIFKHFEHATGLFSTATSLKFTSNSQKKINAAHHKAKGLTLENKQINHQRHDKLNLTMQGK